MTNNEKVLGLTTAGLALALLLRRKPPSAGAVYSLSLSSRLQGYPLGATSAPAGRFNAGEAVTITAAPWPFGSNAFFGWEIDDVYSEDIGGNPEFTLTMDRDHTVVALYTVRG